MTISATNDKTLDLLARFRKLVGPGNANRTLLRLIEAYIREQEGKEHE